jgi:hypothetical protein
MVYIENTNKGVLMANRTSDVTSLNYGYAFSMLGSKGKLKINHNTYLEKVDDETVAVRLYHTKIVQYRSDGSIRLSTGGHQTVTTISRMNDALDGVSIFIRNGDMIACIGGIDYVFEDGMTIDKDNNTNATPFSIYEIDENADRRIQSLEDIAEYVGALTLKAVKVLWRKCKYSQDVIAYYAPIAFIPLIVPRASGSEYWYRKAADRLANG